MIVGALCALPDRAAQAQTGLAEIWSTTLAVDGSATYYGCDYADPGMADCSSALTDDDFTYQGSTFRIRRLYWESDDQELSMGISGNSGQQIKSKLSSLTLNVSDRWYNDKAFAVSASSVIGVVIKWSVNLGWRDGARVTVRLTDTASGVRATPGDRQVGL